MAQEMVTIFPVYTHYFTTQALGKMFHSPNYFYLDLN